MTTLNEILKDLTGALLTLNETLYTAGSSGVNLNERMRTLSSGGGGGGGEAISVGDYFSYLTSGVKPVVLSAETDTYSDVAGTTASTVGGPVARWGSPFSAFSFSQSILGERPTLVSRSAGRALSFNGVDSNLQNPQIASSFFKTFRNEFDTDKSFTFVCVFEPILKSSVSSFLRVHSSTNANSFTRLSIASAANANVLEWNHDVDGNIGDLNYQSVAAPTEAALNVFTVIKNGEKATAFLHNATNDLTPIVTGPIAHHAVQSAVDNVFLGGNTTDRFQGYIYYVALIPGPVFGLPSLINELAQLYDTYLPPTTKTTYSFQEGLSCYVPMQFVAGNNGGISFSKGSFSCEVVGTITGIQGPNDTDLATQFPGTSGNYCVIQNAGDGGVLSDFCSIDNFTLSFDLRVSSAAALQTAFAIFNNVNAENFLEVQVNTSRQALLVLYDGAGASKSATCSFAIPLNTWVKIWVWRDVANIYITVNAETAGTTTTYTNRTNTTTNVRLGTAIPGTRDANLAIADLVFWTRTLSTQERADFMSVGVLS